jgi:hypothetical protein
VKTFKQFLNEMPKMTTLDKDLNRLSHNEVKIHLSHKPEHIGTSDSGHHIVKTHYREGTSFNAVDPQTKQIDMKVTGEHGDGNFRVSMLRAREGGTIRAHEFYHHLVTKQGLTLHSDDHHSPGARHTWKKLSEYPDIEVTHYGKGETHPMHKGDDFGKNYGDDKTHFIARKK